MNAKLTLPVAFCFLFAACGHTLNQNRVIFRGQIKSGEHFKHSFGDRFVFLLSPYASGNLEGVATGWIIEIHEQGKMVDLACLTLPLHGPNPTLIEGWHFRNEENTGPNDGSLNVPMYERHFIFSPDASRLLDQVEITEAEIKEVESFGHGALYIERLRLSAPLRGGNAQILEMRFRCALSWRTAKQR
jgi:hypothetical protein